MIYTLTHQHLERHVDCNGYKEKVVDVLGYRRFVVLVVVWQHYAQWTS